MVEKAKESTKLPEWIDLTFVTLANRLSSRKDPENKKSRKESDASDKINRLTREVLNWIKGKIPSGNIEKQAEKKLNDLEKARKTAADNFLRSLPDINISEFKTDSQLGICAPADPVKVLRTFCNVVIGVHTTLPNAEMTEVVGATFSIVALPQLHAHLHHVELITSRIELEKNIKFWPKSLETKDREEIFHREGKITPSVIAKLIANNELQRKDVNTTSPRLKSGWHSEYKSKDPVAIQVNKALNLLEILLRKAAATDATWEMAKRFSKEYLQLEEQSNQQVITGLSTSYLDIANIMNLGELCDHAHQKIVASLTQSSAAPFTRKKSFPQQRREILVYASHTINPNESEILHDLRSSIGKITQRLYNLTDTECLAYAYHFSRKTTIQVNNKNEIIHNELTIKAAELTCRLLERATETGREDLKVVALRYLAGYLTNPRFYCTKEYFAQTERWINNYQSLEKNSLITKHFQARYQYIEGKFDLVTRNYSQLFLRTMPVSDKSSPIGSLGLMQFKNQDHHLTDIECISYLLPECYAISGKIFENKPINLSEETPMQRNIRRISEAHFGVCCNDWKLEERRILAGFKLRESYLKS
jgi:hypothetical protein